MRDMAGNAARVAVECGGRCRDTNHTSDILFKNKNDQFRTSAVFRPEEPQSAIRNQQSNLKSLRLSKPRSALHVFTKRNHESDSVSIYRGRNQFGNRGAVW